MAEGLEYVLDTLRIGVEFTLYRGRERRHQTSVLAVASTAEQPSRRAVQRLEHEFSLASELNPAWAAQPLQLIHHRGRATLILRDTGGEPLDRLIEQSLEQPIDLARVLRIAVGLASALDHAHRQGLIHRDIKPAAILVDDADQVWLTGFGISSRLAKERVTPAPPEVMAGTFAYMSPEQTGRMNRSVDARSDLYSLGVTLYQLLTGVLPFSAADPMEWVHSHIARQPAKPTERRPIPASLSAIVMRLLAKNAEERYQTAAGLEADLRRCLQEWQSLGRIDPFPLCQEDSSDELRIPEKLYGRERDVDALVTAFDRVRAQGTVELVLVSGYSGVGKSSVVNELHKVLVPSRGIFAAGKFDQYKRDIPYATLAEALQTLVRQILVKSDAEVDQWRRAFVEALGSNGQLITSLIPELEFIIGKQPPVAELGPQEARSRFPLVFLRFLGVFARREHPLALFLDDLQWLDAASLELLKRLATEPEMRYVLLIGAYRDNEVGASHPLMRTLTAMRDTGARIQEIVLAPLTIHDVERLTVDALHCRLDRAAPLALLLHEKTDGNPFFAIQLLTSLADEGLLRFERTSADWIWDLGRIRAKGYSNNVAHFMSAKLRRLSLLTQTALLQFACLGNMTEIPLLAVVLEQSEQEVHTTLREAVDAGLIAHLDKSYAFLHDRIHEAAYSLISERERPAQHVKIGRLLLANLAADSLSEHVFEVARQLNAGAGILVDDNEKVQTAAINLEAGRRAKATSAYVSALRYFVAGYELLSIAELESQRDLIFALSLERAGCEMLTGDLATAEMRLEALALSAANLAESAAVAGLRVDLYAVLSQSDRAVAVCLEYLRQVGVEWSPHPTDADLREEHARIWQQIGSRAIAELIDLPMMHDAGTCATMDVLTKVLPSTQNIDDKLLSLMIMRMVNLSLEYGNSNASCCGYVFFGMILSSRFENYPSGLRFGRLSLDLVERGGLDAFKPRVYQAFGIYIGPWAEHVRSSRLFIKQAFDMASKTGDLTYAAYCCDNLVTNSLACGEHLSDIERETMDGIDFTSKAGFGLIVDILRGQQRLVRTLRGSGQSFSAPDALSFDEHAFEARLMADPNLAIAACWYWIRKVQAYVFVQEHTAALAAVERARVLLWTSPAFFEKAEYHFYAALALSGSMDRFGDDRPHRQDAQMEALAAHLQQIRVWAEHCPENFENRAALVAAEIARIEGRDMDAARLYEAAIESARKNDFVHNEALASELAGRFYVSCGLETASRVHLRNARSCYDRWGADGKVKRLDQLYPRLREERSRSPSDKIGSTHKELDVEAVVKATQAISSEIVLPKLIERLMQITVEHAGAERGLLILVRDGEPRIETEATIGPGKIDVAARNAAAMTALDLPRSMLHYALRTQETVLLDDATSDNLYSSDEYLIARSTRSALCVPIVKQKKTVGALYLENGLSPRVFTPGRVAVLQLLASQASISLENATLYEELEKKVGLLQLLPVSAWTLKPDGTPDFVNQVWLDFAGQTLDFMRSHPEAWMTAIHPEEREAAARCFREGVRSGQGFSFETRSLRASDGVYRWHLQQAVVLRDAEGKVINFVGTTTDIDDQKRAEETLRQTQANLAHVARVATLNAMTASIAHEVSQPLSGILMNATAGGRMLALEPPDLAGVAETVRLTIRDAERASEIVRRLRAMFAAKAPTMEKVDLNDAAREVITLSAGELRRGRALMQTKFADDLPTITADRIQLQQVILNLLLNAVDAMASVEDRARTLLLETSRQDRGDVRLVVRDSGTGLKADTVEKLFEPFYTTKAHGMGIGLSICRSIIESHGGRLWAHANEIGSGATFTFNLPGAADGLRGA